MYCTLRVVYFCVFFFKCAAAKVIAIRNLNGNYVVERTRKKYSRERYVETVDEGMIIYALRRWTRRLLLCRSRRTRLLFDASDQTLSRDRLIETNFGNDEYGLVFLYTLWLLLLFFFFMPNETGYNCCTSIKYNIISSNPEDRDK